MAEGHAVIRWKRALAALIGEPVQAIQLPKRWGAAPQRLLGTTLVNVTTHGKLHLLHFSNADTILCHAMQYGSWQVGARGMELRKAARFVRLHLTTPAHEAVFYHGPIIELLTPEELAINPRLQSIGPDVMAPDFDRDEAWRRLQTIPDTPIGDAVLNQHVMAGIGNIYKSEGLFLAGIDPQLPVRAVARAQIEAYWDAVIPLMWAGTERFGPTATLSPEQQAATGELRWVYQRSKRPCLRCGTPIKLIRQGINERATFFCPRCQATPAERAIAS